MLRSRNNFIAFIEEYEETISQGRHIPYIKLRLNTGHFIAIGSTYAMQGFTSQLGKFSLQEAKNLRIPIEFVHYIKVTLDNTVTAFVTAAVRPPRDPQKAYG